MKLRRLFFSLLLTLTIAAVGVAVQTPPKVHAAPTVNSISPTSGPIGTRVTVRINEPTAGAVDVYLDDGTSDIIIESVTIPASVGSTYNFSFYIPEDISGGRYTMYIVRGSTIYGSEDFVVTPRITEITPDIGSEGTIVTIDGDGFVPGSNSAFYVYFNNVRITPLSGSINSRGELNNVRITIPSGSYTRGEYAIRLEDRRNGNAATSNVMFTIEPKLTLTPSTGGSGDTIEVTGSGFAGGQVTISFDGQQLISTTVPSSGGNAGNFSTTITIPTASPGTHTIAARDSKGEVTATFTISQQITGPSTPVSVGEPITISGNGFGINQQVTLTIDGVQIPITPSIYTSATGTFSVTFTLPAMIKGEHTVRAQIGSNTPSSTTITVQGTVKTDVSSGPSGGTVVLNGGGFTPGTAEIVVSAKSTGTNTSAGTITVDSTGSINNVSFTIPLNLPLGLYTLIVQGVPVGDFTVSPGLALTPNPSVGGATVRMDGTGFSSQKVITFKIDNIYTLNADQGTITTDASGNFSATFQVPSLPGGQHTITATDSDGKVGSAKLTIEPNVHQMNPNPGKMGDQVVITGTGFAPNRQIAITFGGHTMGTSPAIVTTNEYGSFETYFNVPNITAGKIPVTVSDGISTATATYTLHPTIVVSDPPATNASPIWIGADFGIAGANFKPGATLNITFDNDPTIIATAVVDVQGIVNLSFKVPTLAAGVRKMKLNDGTVSHEIDFVIESTAPPAPTLDRPKDGSKPKQPVTFSWKEVSDQSGVAYEFQLSQDPNFGEDAIIYADTVTNGITLTLPNEPKLPDSSDGFPYLWRVRAIDGAGNTSDWSVVNTFKLGGFALPSWMIHVWYSLGIIIALAFGVWFGRRMAYQSY